MQLSAFDLQQIDNDYINSLPKSSLALLCQKLSTDLKEAHDRLNQNPRNSSRPPSSEPPWNNSQSNEIEESLEQNEELTEKDLLSGNGEFAQDDDEDNESDNNESDNNEQEKSQETNHAQDDKSEDSTKKPGKQPGAQGFGLKFGTNIEVSETIFHKPDTCQCCGKAFDESTKFTSYTACFEIELMIPLSGVGLELKKTKHIYDEGECHCGHISRSEPGRCPKEKGWTVELTEWHMVGPLLASFIVCLSKHHHMSRQRIHQWLFEWLGLSLSVGTINQCIHEAGRALTPVVEGEIMDEIMMSALLHADETPWKEKKEKLWLWVFSCASATLFIVGRRAKKIAQKILGQFNGWLMSDGYLCYRDYEWRLRCWAHLLRKARGLAESLEQQARNFGKQTLQLLEALIQAIYQARENPTGEDLYKLHQEKLLKFCALCEEHWDCEHEKTRALAREFWYDWDAIWCVLENPSLPLTNNEAERALRHWVIARRISFGTRTAQGTAAFTAIASVIDTCYKRNVAPWEYIADVIRVRRKGLNVPPLPAVAA